VDDDEKTRGALSEALRLRGHRPRATSSATEAIEVLRQEEFDVVAADLELSEPSGLHLCERVVANYPEVPFVAMTSTGSVETAVAAIRAGAFDLYEKPFPIAAIASALERAAQRRAVLRELKRARERTVDLDLSSQLLGDSRATRVVFAAIDAASKSDGPVLLTGPRGTGKKRIAQAIHERSPRQRDAFFLVSCARAQPQAIEDRLFDGTQGLLKQRGTVLLHDIDALPRPLQDAIGEALADDPPIVVPRIIAATGIDLEARAVSGHFSRVLFDRFMANQVDVPPLSAREYDVLQLAQHFARHFAAVMNKKVEGISVSAAERLMVYAWPGNVRELVETVERAVAGTRSDQIVVDDLPEHIRRYSIRAAPMSEHDPIAPTLEEVEQRHVLRVLAAVHGNKRRAARVLGLDVKTLRRKLESYGIRGEVRAPGLDRY
jgi:two-component system response regulator HydG